MSHLKCLCQHCGGPIEFPAYGVGSVVTCPHCGVETLLTNTTSAPSGNATSERLELQLNPTAPPDLSLTSSPEDDLPAGLNPRRVSRSLILPTSAVILL